MIASLVLLMTGCQSIPNTQSTSQPHNALAEQTAPSTQDTLRTLHLDHAYSRIIVDSQTNRPVDLANLVKQLKNTDVVFIGEYHGNHASHLLQIELQSKLFKQRPNQILSMEMFETDQQNILNRYLDGEVGEKYLINEAPAWPNYAGAYRPMVEFAKEHFIPVIAANAPAKIVRCVGQFGEDYLDWLPDTEQSTVAQQAFLDHPSYREKFHEWMQQMRHGKMDEQRKASSYAAQLLRDNTMAESILQALDHHPEAQVIHLNGSFHSAEHLGTVALLKQRRPDLTITVITPIRAQNWQQPEWTGEDLTQGDFIYLIRSQPEDYVNAHYRRQAMQKMFHRSKEKTKACYPPANSPATQKATPAD